MKSKLKKWYRKSKGYIALGLAVLTLLYTSLVNFMVDKANAEGANDRVTTFIQLAQGQSVSDGLNLEDLTKDELRFLGVYLSNFYIPFGTELGVAADNNELIEQMVEALCLNMNWEEEMAYILVEEILGLSRANDKKLEIYGSKGYQDGEYIKIENVDCNYFNFLRLMLGAEESITMGYDVFAGCDYIPSLEWMKLSDEEKEQYLAEGYEYINFRGFVNTSSLDSSGLVQLYREKLSYVYFGYTSEDGEFIPVCDASLIPTVATSSQTVFREVLASIETDKGYGFSFFDLTSDEIETDDLNGLDVTDSELLSLSIYGQEMYVDCFGNIIQKGGAHQYIVIPACMNPYVWIPVDSNGDDIMNPGVAYNIVNFNSMSMADSNTLLIRGGYKNNQGFMSGTLNKYEYTPISLDTDIVSGGISDLAVAMVNASLGFYSNQSDHIGFTEVDVGTNAISSASTFQYENCLPSIIIYSEGNLASDISFLNIDDTLGVEGSATLCPLRMIRGSTEYDLSESGKGLTLVTTNTHKSYVDTIKGAESAFKSLYPLDKSYYLADEGGLSSDSFSPLDGDSGAELAARNSAVGIEDSSLADFLCATEVINEDGSLTMCYSGQVPTTKLFIIDNMIFIDNLGVYNLQEGGSIDYSTINFAHYLDSSGKSPVQMLDSYAKDPANGYSSSFGTIQSGKLNSGIQVSEASVSSVYSTYLIASLYNKSAESKKETIGQLGFRLNVEDLPSISNSPISVPGDYEVALVEKQIREWTYYLLHPTEGLSYVSLLVKNKTNAFLVGWHNDMVGTNGVGAITGTTQYRSAIGFVTTPDLSEIQWTATLINLYNKIIPFLIIAMLIVMLFSYVAGILQFQKALFGVIIFAVFLFMPVSLIHNAISISNGISQKIYSDRFTYWAIIQQESYIKNLDDAMNADTYSNYLRELYALNNETYVNQGGDSIVLRWQAPKKMASLVMTQKDNKLISNLNTNLLSMVINNNTMSGEYYLDSESTYMFRSYTDISNFSRFIYHGIKQNIRESYSYAHVSNANQSLIEYIDNIGPLYRIDRENGFANYSLNGSSSVNDTLRVMIPLSSEIYNDALLQKGTIKNLTINDYVGLNQDLYQYSIPSFTNRDQPFVMVIANNMTPGNEVYINEYLSNYEEEDFTGLAAYGLMSESPFYYYSWCLYDMGMSTEPGAKGNYKNLLLGNTHGSFFYNTEGTDSSMSGVVTTSTGGYANGELKDFMDMKSLFTYVIPYLNEGNEIVREWDDIYGLYIYEGVPTEEGHQNDPDIMASPELQQKYWHNLNVARLYGIYSPWVDLMYDCSYADAETITVMGEKYVVEDPLNPASYPDERPMIFSESEMAVYGLIEADLTEVERKILECNRQMEERMYELLNYYNFSDATLNTAAAMNCTFVFNSVFSETNLLGESVNIYPQCFEINNFSYDAFLRFILANSLGEDLTNQEDFYMAVVEKSSTTTAIMYIISDLFSQYALPAVKIFIIIIIFISSILLILVTAFRVDPRQKFIPSLIKSLISPMLSYLLINIGFAWVLSLFMGTGNNAVTQSKQVVIQMGDPVIVMLIITALDVICMVLYWKIIKSVIEDIKKNSSLAKSFISGSIGGTFAMAGNFMSNKISGNNATSASHNGGYNEEGSSRVSPRASQRGSMDVTESSREESSRISEAKRETYKEDKSERNTRSSKEGKNRINNTIKSGSKKLSSGSNRNS